jgi:hypothetical protein
MRRAVVLALNLLPLLGGCRALVRDAETVEYRPGSAPTTMAATYDATYRLYVPEKLETGMGIEVTKGEAVGFRQEPDGSIIAVAGQETKPIPDGRCVWLCTPKPVTRWERFLVRTRDKCETAVMLVFLGPALVINGCVTGEWP